MASAYGFIKRILTAQNPPKVEKEANPLRFGILGAAAIAPIALILAARSHPDVEIVAVAARDQQRAQKFAKKHAIKKVYYGATGYQQLITDPDIDAIYNPLPNSLHFEWTAKALAAGKHVLLEKPSTNTAKETCKLFEIAKAKDVVLLEALHYCFHPSFQRFQEIINSGELGKLKSMRSELSLPDGFFGGKDIRFNFDLGGGSLMDLGVYPISCIRAIISTEPISVIAATHTAHTDSRLDTRVDATFSFPDDITGQVVCSLKSPWRFGIIPPLPKVSFTAQMEGGEITLFNGIGPWLYHTITVIPKTGVKRVEKAYKQNQGPGEEWWTTYRYQLEAFVDKVRGRTPKVWISDEYSINQMKAVEMIYEKLDLPHRPTSSYLPSEF